VGSSMSNYVSTRPLRRGPAAPNSPRGSLTLSPPARGGLHLLVSPPARGGLHLAGSARRTLGRARAAASPDRSAPIEEGVPPQREPEQERETEVETEVEPEPEPEREREPEPEPEPEPEQEREPEPEPEPEPDPLPAQDASDDAARRAEELSSKQRRREQDQRQKQAQRRRQEQHRQKQKRAAAAQQKRAAEAALKAQAPAADGNITAYEMEQKISVLRTVVGGDDAAFTGAMPQIVGGTTGRPGGTEYRIWAKQVEGLLTVRSIVTFPFPGNIIQRAFTDQEFQTRVDEWIKVKECIAHSGGCEVIYHEMRLPSPMTNRDYVYFRRTHSDEARGEYAVFLRDVPDMGTKYKAVKKKAVRAGLGKHFMDVLIQNHRDGPGCRVVSELRDNPAGAVPKWLVNLASKKSLPGYYKGFETMAATMMMEDGVLTASEAKKWGVMK